jgi:long-chain acyl-CoA synthetase
VKGRFNAGSEQPSSRLHDFIGCDEARTLWGLFRERVRRTPEGIAYREYDGVAGSWRDCEWQAIAKRTDRFRSALAHEGLTPGDRVAVLLPNSTDWVCFDMAAHSLGLVVVAIYPHDSAANSAFILGHSDARVLIVDTLVRWEALHAYRSEFRLLKSVWLRSGGPITTAANAHPNLKHLNDNLKEKFPLPAAYPTAPTSLATLIYTSGTTGQPKGVMLSHHALLWNAEAVAMIIPPRTDDVFLSILPLAHAFERTVGYYLAMAGGATVAYARSAQQLREDLVAIRPTVLLGVPRLYERMHAAILAQVEGSALRSALLQRAKALGWRQFEAAQHRGPKLDLAARLAWVVLKRLVADRVTASFGGRLRAAVSGGAPLDRSVAEFLLGLGLPVVEGYGLTEAAPVVSANATEDNLPGSVGRPLKGLEVRLSDQGELMVRSPAVMMGYWKDQTQTERVLDAAGWLSTGDIGEIRDGRIFIPGRLKEIIVLSTGEKVNPNLVEAEITRDTLFDQVAVIGDGRPFIAALAVLNIAAWKRLARDDDVDPDRPNAEPVKTGILARIESLLTALPAHARVRAVHLCLEPWTIDAGLLTPTLKVKRDNVQRLFAKEIDALYAGHWIPRVERGDA